MKQFLIPTVALLISTGAANAVVLLTSNFDGNDITVNTNATNVSWTTDAAVTMDNSGNVAAVGDTFRRFAALGAADNLVNSTNLNTDRPDDRGYSFAFTTTQTIDLTELQINAAHINGSGGNQSFVSDLNWSISGGPSGSIDGIDYAALPAVLTQTIDLTGNTLAPGSYTVTVTMDDMVGGGAFAMYDGVTLSGDVVPEPTSSLFVALAGFALILRRRR